MASQLGAEHLQGGQILPTAAAVVVVRESDYRREISTSFSTSPPLASIASLSLRNPGKYVKLNVGGSLFQTSTDTLSKQGKECAATTTTTIRVHLITRMDTTQIGEHMLSVMFSGRMEVKTDEEGQFLRMLTRLCDIGLV